MLVHRLKSDVDIFERSRVEPISHNKAFSSPRSKALTGLESKAVRIRLNSSNSIGSKENSPRAANDKKSQTDESMSLSGRRIGSSNRRQTPSSSPRHTSSSVSKFSQSKRTIAAMSSLDSPEKADTSGASSPGSESMRSDFLSPVNTAARLSQQQPSSNLTDKSGRERGRGFSSGSNTATPASTSSTEAYNTPYSAGGGVSLSRPSIQRSHAKTTISSRGHEVSALKNTPDKRRLDILMKRSPMKSQRSKATPGSEKKADKSRHTSKQFNDSNLGEISFKIPYLPGKAHGSNVKGSKMIQVQSTLSRQLDRTDPKGELILGVKSPELNILVGVTRSSPGTDLEDNISSPESVCLNANSPDVASVGCIAELLSTPDREGDEDEDREFFDECDVSSEEVSPCNESDHVSRVQMRSQNLPVRGPSFFFPRSTHAELTDHIPDAVDAIRAEDESLLISATASNIKSSIYDISRSFATAQSTHAHTAASNSEPIHLRASMQTQTGVISSPTEQQVKPLSTYAKSAYEEESEENCSLCFSAVSGTNAQDFMRLPEDSFCHVDYNKLMSAAREVNASDGALSQQFKEVEVHARVYTPQVTRNVQQEAAPVTTWLSLQSPIDKMDRNIPTSALKQTVCPPVDLLYTPEPSHPYRRKSFSQEKSPSMRVYKVNGSVLEDGEIDEGLTANKGYDTGRRNVVLGQCLGLDELLWGSSTSSPSNMPLAPNSLSFSAANAPYPGNSFQGYRGCSDTPSAPLRSASTPPLYRALTPKSESNLKDYRALLGSAVRLTPPAAQLKDDMDAVNVLMNMMHMQSASPLDATPHQSICGGEEEGEGDIPDDDSSIFALDGVHDHHNSSFNSDSDTSQNQEISAVLKNLLEGDINCVRGSDIFQEREEEDQRDKADDSQRKKLNFEGGGSLDDVNNVLKNSGTISNPEDAPKGPEKQESNSSVIVFNEEERAHGCDDGDLDLDSSAMYTAATTISIDFPRNLYGSKHTSKGLNNSRAGRPGGPQSCLLPNLMVTRKKRRKDASIDMKEIVLKALGGESTTVALTFGNTRPVAITLRPKAILVRYEPLRSSALTATVDVDAAGKKYSKGGASQGGKGGSDTEEQRQLIFNATPDNMTLQPDTETILHVTFSPPHGSSGVFSGALKMKAGNKSFVMLLRGEVQPLSSQVQDPVNEKGKEKEREVESKKASSSACVENAPSSGSERQDGSKEITSKMSTVIREEVGRGGGGGDLLNASLMRQSKGTVDLPPVTRPASPYRAVEASSFSSRNVLQVSSHNDSCSNISASVRDQSTMDPAYHKQDKVRHWLDMERERMLESRLPLGAGAGASPQDRKKDGNREALTPQQFRSVLNLRSAESSPSRKMILSGDQTASHMGRSGPSQRSSSAQPCKRSQSSSSGYVESGAARRDVLAGDRQPAGDAYTARTGSEGRARNGNGSGLNNFRESEIKLSRQLIEQQHDDPRDAVSREASGMFSGRHAELGHQELRRLPPPSLYFRSQIANFGSISVGTNSRLQIELCNSSNDEVTAYIGDCALPFVVLRNEVKLRPRSFVKVAIRFVPVSGPKEFRSQLVAQTSNGRHHTEVSLYGSSHWM